MFNRFKTFIDSAGAAVDSQSHHGRSSTKLLPPKFPYSRPHFLNISGKEEIKLTADHKMRPIIVPRDSLLWNIGYAECVNSGKSTWNEDQAAIHDGVLNCTVTSDIIEKKTITYTYVGLFDGHAGVGAALSAAHQLHHVLHERLVDAADDIFQSLYTVNQQRFKFNNIPINTNDLIIGALESAFIEMDKMMGEDALQYYPPGGCTALVVLVILGKAYVANAGDSRAVYCTVTNGTPLSTDFTPETERLRIRNLAEMKPDLLQGHYTHRDYSVKPTVDNLGKRIRYRNGSMKGWAYKTINIHDIKQQITAGEGKRSRIMGTISVTRGFGDHDLKSIHNQVPIKPFLSPHPEVQIIDLEGQSNYVNDCIVLGTDGLWDVTTNDEAASIVSNSIQLTMEKRYIGAAQALVANARGKLKGESAVSWSLSNGKSASFDDISVFVIPLHPQRMRFAQWFGKQDINNEKGGNEDKKDGEEVVSDISVSEITFSDGKCDN